MSSSGTSARTCFGVGPAGRKAAVFGMVICLGLSGCMDLTEEIWFEPDGQSRVEVSVGYTDVANAILTRFQLNGQMKDQFSELESYARDELGARSVHISEYTEGKRHFTKFAATLPTSAAAEQLLNHLHQLGAPADETDNPVQTSNTVRITPGFAGRLRYEQHISMVMRDDQGQLVSPAEDALAKSLLAMTLADARIRVRVHGAKIITSIGETGGNEQTVEWTIPLIETIHGGSFDRRMSAGIRVRPPYEWWLLAGFGALIVWLLMRRIGVSILLTVREQ